MATPKRKNKFSVIEEVDEELQKTERKSMGDKSSSDSSNDSKKKVKQKFKSIEDKVTPDINESKSSKKKGRSS